jgi:hypothetical protein
MTPSRATRNRNVPDDVIMHTEEHEGLVTRPPMEVTSDDVGRKTGESWT